MASRIFACPESLRRGVKEITDSEKYQVISLVILISILNIDSKG